MSECILAWHFLADDGKRRDGEMIPLGATEDYEGPLEMCASGLHASERLLDALTYAPGDLARRVECWGDVTRDTDKFICRHRRELWRLDAMRVLHEFACRVAEDALTTAKVTDERCWGGIKVKRAWLAGEATIEELAAAEAAAEAAAGAVVGTVAEAAAMAVARVAAWAVVGTAEAAARVAAWAVVGTAEAAARVAARDKYNTWLTDMIEEARL